ncbi:hypothetical protein BT96DRAFT_1078554 [Gymnopus androsaceus JB14]|uniref:Uncharacterized protein n=1 Tax=Gymnopus androsaceus JB14 TaxID=1447944 RepID=A0A6A4HWN1_9AGAR|nr:hypothetical protein BT96DRAFT_1078554 [Gymnopus androsaceus JB14]
MPSILRCWKLRETMMMMPTIVNMKRLPPTSHKTVLLLLIARIRLSQRRSSEGKKKKAQSALEARDRKYLSLFIATSNCRRIPWDNFSTTEGKSACSSLPNPKNARCCDNCQPDKFPIETIKISYPYLTLCPSYNSTFRGTL